MWVSSVWIFIVSYRKSSHKVLPFIWIIISSFFVINQLLDILLTINPPFTLLNNALFKVIESVPLKLFYLVGFTLFLAFLIFRAGWLAVKRAEWNVRALGVIVFLTMGFMTLRIILAFQISIRYLSEMGIGSG
jgi:hypothetical protein